MSRAVALIAALAAGCGAAVDTAYVLGSGRAHTATEESSPTEQAVERIEYEGVHRGGGAVALGCFERTRAVERRWTVHRTYRRQGSYDRVAYSGAIFGDVMIGGLTGGLIAAACLSDDSDVSCKNLWFAAPFAVDIVYSLIRRATVKPKILLSKHEGTASLGLAASATREDEISCDQVASVWLGHADGPSDRDILAGNDGGRRRRLREGALQLELGAEPPEPPEPIAATEPAAAGDAGPNIWLTSEAAMAWAASPGARIWAIGADGVPRDVAVDRCAVLRPFAASLSGDRLERFNRECPVSEPAR